ncbi:NYN domain-containing protein [Candidatus Parcubacteria bacterium]|nr:NYN domain-containing protein [Candidatus Parcubacteria bacterium]
MTVIKHKAQRVGVFIDTQNIYHSAKNIHHARANFGAILKDALDGRILVRAIAYVATTEGGEESAFFGALEKVGIETRMKPLQIFAGGAKKANWDIDMAMDAVKLAGKLDTIVLITGDGDFVSLVEYLQNTHGTQVEVVSFGRSSSSKLIEAADDFLDLDKNPKKYLIMGFNGRTPRRDATEGAGTASAA